MIRRDLSCQPVLSCGSGQIWENPSQTRWRWAISSRFPVTRVTLGMFHPYKEVFAVLLTFAHFTDDFGNDPELVWTLWRWPASAFPKNPFSIAALHQLTLLPLPLALHAFILYITVQECDWKVSTCVILLVRLLSLLSHQ